MKKIAISLVLFLTVYFSFLVSNSEAQWAQADKHGEHSSDFTGRYIVSKILIDTIALKYFPLAVGNVYKYHFGSSSGYQYNYKIRIVKDTVINSRRYFVTSSYFPGSVGQIIRLDSNSGNLYVRSNSGYCPYSPFEELSDSLRARIGDSTLVCTSYVPKHYCLDTGYSTLFGMQIKSKRFSRNTTEVSTTVTYGMNLGIIFSTSSDFWGLASESMLGCYVNGVLYGDTVLTDVESISSEVPTSFALSQNYPNPFNQSSIFKFQCSRLGGSSTGLVKIIVYDAAGREVQTLVNETLEPGTYEVRFDGSGLNSGVYFYRLTAGDFKETRRMVLIK